MCTRACVCTAFSAENHRIGLFHGVQFHGHAEWMHEELELLKRSCVSHACGALPDFD